MDFAQLSWTLAISVALWGKGMQLGCSKASLGLEEAESFRGKETEGNTVISDPYHLEWEEANLLFIVKSDSRRVALLTGLVRMCESFHPWLDCCSFQEKDELFVFQLLVGKKIDLFRSNCVRWPSFFLSSLCLPLEVTDKKGTAVSVAACHVRWFETREGRGLPVCVRKRGLRVVPARYSAQVWRSGSCASDLNSLSVWEDSFCLSTGAHLELQTAVFWSAAFFLEEMTNSCSSLTAECCPFASANNESLKCESPLCGTMARTENAFLCTKRPGSFWMWAVVSW